MRSSGSLANNFLKSRSDRTPPEAVCEFARRGGEPTAHFVAPEKLDQAVAQESHIAEGIPDAVDLIFNRTERHSIARDNRHSARVGLQYHNSKALDCRRDHKSSGPHQERSLLIFECIEAKLDAVLQSESTDELCELLLVLRIVVATHKRKSGVGYLVNHCLHRLNEVVRTLVSA